MPIVPSSFRAIACLACLACDGERDGGSGSLQCGGSQGRVARVVDGDTLVIELVCRTDADCNGSSCEAGVCGRNETVRTILIVLIGLGVVILIEGGAFGL